MVEVKDRNEYLLKYGSISHWVRNFTGDTPNTYCDEYRWFENWLRDGDSEFKDFTPDMLVAFQKKHRDYQLVDLILEHLHSVKAGVTTNTINRRDAALKSFFRYNRASLPEDVYNVKGGKPSTPGVLSLRELQEIVLASSPLYRAVFSCLYAGFMGWGEVGHWSRTGYQGLMEQLDSGESVVVAKQDGRKQYAGIPFYNLIGGDALELLKIYLRDYRKPGDVYVFKTKADTNISYETVRMYWGRKLKQLGFIEQPLDAGGGTRYGKGLHEVRDLARTQWTRSPANKDIAEFMLGHVGQLDPNQYDKIFRDVDYAKREYRKALPWLNIITEDPTKISIEQHEAEMDRLRVVEEAVKPLQELMQYDDFRRDFAELLERVKQRGQI